MGKLSPRPPKRVQYAALPYRFSGRSREVMLVTSRETRLGYAGASVPGVQLFQLGRMPTYQNSAFDEIREPSSLGATAQWTTRQHLLGSDHRAVFGGDISRGRWRNERTRNGGVTWRPYSTGVTNFDPTNAGTWQTVGSDWGGTMRLDSDVASDALFIQDYSTLGSRLTVTPGVRFGHWAGFVRPRCSVDLATGVGCYRFEAVHATGLDPRIGAVWDGVDHARAQGALGSLPPRDVFALL